MDTLLLDTRKALGLTQDMMAMMLGTTRSSVAKAERGQRTLNTPTTLRLLALQRSLPPAPRHSRRSGPTLPAMKKSRDRLDIRLPTDPAAALRWQQTQLWRRGYMLTQQADRMQEALDKARQAAAWQKGFTPDNSFSARVAEHVAHQSARQQDALSDELIAEYRRLGEGMMGMGVGG